MSKETWSPEKVALLKELWPLDLSGRQIAEIMALKKMPAPRNAIFKKAERLGLPPRVSPIIRTPAKKPKLPTKEQRADAIQTIVSAPHTILPNYHAPLLPRAEKYDLKNGCCWPIGDPKSPSFRFCGEKKSGRSYCTRHNRIAFVPQLVPARPY